MMLPLPSESRRKVPRCLAPWATRSLWTQGPLSSQAPRTAASSRTGHWGSAQHGEASARLWRGGAGSRRVRMEAHRGGSSVLCCRNTVEYVNIRALPEVPYRKSPLPSPESPTPSNQLSTPCW